MLNKVYAILLFSATILLAAEFRVDAYYPNWLQYSQFTPTDVRYSFLTDIHYGYFVPSEDGSSLTNADESDEPNFKKLLELAKQNKVGVIAIVGGAGNEESMKAVASSDDACSKLAETVKSFAEASGLKGVELDWIPSEDSEYKAWGKLVVSLANAGLSVYASAVGSEEAASAYPAEALSQLAGLMVSFTDQASADEEKVVPNSNFAKAKDVLKTYSSKLASEKIIPVVPMYGKSFYKATGLGSAHEGVGSGNEGYLQYKDLMTAFDTPDYKVSFDEASLSEVAVSATETVVFNGIPSMKAMATFVKENGFGGVAMYDISGDHKEPIVSLLVTVGQILRPSIDYQPKKKKK
ncbi:MAG: glycoside hydrolase family 18 protein [Fibrobacter sp.]|nr:glycoside hydrolase family 18 protein [Fibrobacter sp.]